MPFPVAPYDTCSFCLDLSGERECAFVTENDRAAAQVDERQYERGAMLIIPKLHRETILDIEESELEAVYALAKRMAMAAERAYGAVGANIYQNNGLGLTTRTALSCPRCTQIHGQRIGEALSAAKLRSNTN